MIQTKLSFSQPGDKYEHEADRIAAQIMRMQEPAELPGKGHLASVQPMTENPGPLESSGINVLNGGGQPLLKSTRTFFEPRFGRDFSQVRMHTGSKASKLATAVNARAFTLGRDIVFKSGQFSPGTMTGKKLIAHELTHVIQQKNNTSRILMRTCDCSSIGRRPNQMENTFLDREFTGLVDREYCILHPPPNPALSQYNCFAYALGITDHHVTGDMVRGSDSSVRRDDFDRYFAEYGFYPCVRSHAEIVLYINNIYPLHAAKRSTFICDGEPMFESKLGENFILVHKMNQISGIGYGRPEAFYCRLSRTMNQPIQNPPRERVRGQSD
ncbi:MAG: DUF4157 domain-containing protein [bacterium]|nr:DUF4157 domain-containing protein [bacterium]